MISVWGCALGNGCGDPPLCHTEVLVAFEQTSITADSDAIAPGAQTDVHIRTSLQPGDIVDLDVLAADGTALDTLHAAVAGDGSVVFPGASVPVPRVVLHATGAAPVARARTRSRSTCSPAPAVRSRPSPRPTRGSRRSACSAPGATRIW